MLKLENWFWCDLCGCRSYVYDCDCYGSICNGGGCKKCENQRKLAKEAEVNGTAPSIESLKEIFKDSVKDETIETVFSKSIDAVIYEEKK